MHILSIGYVGFPAADLSAWRRFASLILATDALELRAPGKRAALGVRLDERSARFLITSAGQDDAPFFGFEVADAAALESAARELLQAGFATRPATDEELVFRQVQGMRHFTDPAGYRVELFFGPAQAASAFAPTRPMGGYRTGDMGFGHAVLTAPRLEPLQRLYCDVMGFRLSDYITQPYRRLFLHINGRHHSLALAERDAHGIAHLMVELNDFDDVGRTYDIALREYPDSIYSTLGRHSNDHMVSFYVKTPSGFPLEYGWGGRVVDDATWRAEEVFGPSLWGHDRIGASPDLRQAALKQRDYALEHGLRAPLPARWQ